MFEIERFNSNFFDKYCQEYYHMNHISMTRVDPKMVGKKLIFTFEHCTE